MNHRCRFLDRPQTAFSLGIHRSTTAWLLGVSVFSVGYFTCGRSTLNASGTLAAREEVERGLIERVRALEVSAPPVGTVVAYAGVWPPKQNGKPQSESQIGWLLCDGRTVAEIVRQTQLTEPELRQLWESLDDTRLPDYRGYFLRGVGGAADVNPDATQRKHPSKAHVTGDQVGTVQLNATKLPNTSFVTDDSGEHEHTSPTVGPGGGNFEVPPGNRTGFDYEFGAPTTKNGHHAHQITRGGDHETRPNNVAVHWIIKFR